MTDARQLIDAAPVSRLQIRVLVICIFANMAEGYDLLSMSLAVVPLADDWNLTGTDTGILLAMGPIGMAIGAMGLAPMSDRFGRRLLMIVSLALITVFTGFSAIAGDIFQLSAFRMLAGIGIGGMLPLLTITVSEFAPTHRRTAAIGVLSIGLPLGSAIGGAGAAVLMSRSGWEGAFALGAVITGIACALVVVGIPNTPDFLETKNTNRSRLQLDDLLVRMGIDPHTSSVSNGTANAVEKDNSTTGFEIRSWQMIVVILLFVMIVVTYYFSTMWLPKLLVMAGMSTDSGISGVLLLSLGAATSGIVVAVLSTRISLFRLITVFTLTSAVLLGIFSLVSTNLLLALVVAPALGLVQCAISIGLYALVPALFGPENRSAAMGLGIGVSRIGMILMPIGIGMLIDRSWSPESLFRLMIIPTLTTAVLVYLLWRDKSRRETSAAEFSSMPARERAQS
ncbi:MFS transporter [Rhodococcus qingshengii]|uniref:Major facilitator superfamily (MFS) profile domain-containing protein n=1 Tax=Rhodococcus qingshengii TaxID=334542 RepID=A0A2A5J253_RHOSG|nr:MFS transporter [Rhodococcus qingshengii]PCK23051.1 hypothetical protein CHR55_31085 [Rhodococcus qingshengii]